MDVRLRIREPHNPDRVAVFAGTSAVTLLRLLLLKAVTLIGLPETAPELLLSWIPLRGFFFRDSRPSSISVPCLDDPSLRTESFLF